MTVGMFLVVLLFIALGCTIAALMGKCPLAVPVLLICLVMLIAAFSGHQPQWK